jgi:rare lipoprotein A (peptidoglycan hydrolase)
MFVAPTNTLFPADIATDENGANCGKKVKLVNKANGNSIVATVADSCPSCQVNGNIDLSEKAFSTLADGNMGLGILDVEWGYI